MRIETIIGGTGRLVRRRCVSDNGGNAFAFPYSRRTCLAGVSFDPFGRGSRDERLQV